MKVNYRLRQAQRGWLRKQQLIEMKGGGCQKCGYSKCSRSLSFHHRDPKSKQFSLDVRRIGNRDWKIVLEEASKCDLLCMNCHLELHDAETNKDYLGYEKILHESHLKICLDCGREFKVKNCRVEIGGGKYCSWSCWSKVMKTRYCQIKPSAEELSELLWLMPTTKIAEKYGVSDKAVEKWCKKHGLSKPPRGYWSKSAN